MKQRSYTLSTRICVLTVLQDGLRRYAGTVAEVKSELAALVHGPSLVTLP